MSNNTWRVEEGYQVFAGDGGEEFGAVRAVRPGGRAELIIYVENGGEFTVPFGAIKSVHSQKVILDVKLLDHKLRAAILHAHENEDPSS